MEIKDMSMEDIEVRSAELEAELGKEDANIEDLTAEVEALEKRKAEIEKEAETRKAEIEAVEKKSIEVEETGKEEIRKSMDIKELRNTDRYIDAYAEYVKGNEKELRALLTENATEAALADNQGKVAVPEFVYDVVKTAWEKVTLLDYVRKTSLKGNLKVNFELSSTGADVHNEGTSAIEPEVLVHGIVTLVPVSIKKLVEISDEVYDMRGEAFLRYIYEEITYKIAQATANALLFSIFQLNGVPSATSPSVGELTEAISISTVADALGLLSAEATNPILVMNRATWSKFKAVQYAAQFPIDPFEGLPIYFSDMLPAYDDEDQQNMPYLIVGDFYNGALLNYPNGEDIEIKLDTTTKMDSDLIRILGRRFTGIGIVADKSFVKVSKEGGN